MLAKTMHKSDVTKITSIETTVLTDTRLCTNSRELSDPFRLTRSIVVHACTYMYMYVHAHVHTSTSPAVYFETDGYKILNKSSFIGNTAKKFALTLE